MIFRFFTFSVWLVSILDKDFGNRCKLSSKIIGLNILRDYNKDYTDTK
jgi:hypothetical protein